MKPIAVDGVTVSRIVTGVKAKVHMETLNCSKNSHFLKSGGLFKAMNEMVYLAPDVFRFPCFIVPALQTTCGVEWLIHPEFQNNTTNVKYPRLLDIRIFCVVLEQY